MPLSVEMHKDDIAKLISITDDNNYEAFEKLLHLQREHLRNKLEKENDDEIRGQCKLLEKLLNLKASIVLENK